MKKPWWDVLVLLQGTLGRQAYGQKTCCIPLENRDKNDLKEKCRPSDVFVVVEICNVPSMSTVGNAGWLSTSMTPSMGSGSP